MGELCISPVPLRVQSDIFKYSESFQGYLIFTKHKEKKKITELKSLTKHAEQQSNFCNQACLWYRCLLLANGLQIDLSSPDSKSTAKLGFSLAAHILHFSQLVFSKKMPFSFAAPCQVQLCLSLSLTVSDSCFSKTTSVTAHIYAKTSGTCPSSCSSWYSEDLKQQQKDLASRVS